MNQWKNNDLEFEAWDTDEDIQRISRTYFRIPIQELDRISIRINNDPFKLINITSVGVSIRLLSVDVFYVGEIINTIELDIDGYSFSFKGRVRHISPMNSNGFICGIELIDSIQSRKRYYLELVKKKYNTVLTSSIITSKR